MSEKEEKSVFGRWLRPVQCIGYTVTWLGQRAGGLVSNLTPTWREIREFEERIFVGFESQSKYHCFGRLTLVVTYRKKS